MVMLTAGLTLIPACGSTALTTVGCLATTVGKGGLVAEIVAGVLTEMVVVVAGGRWAAVFAGLVAVAAGLAATGLAVAGLAADLATAGFAAAAGFAAVAVVLVFAVAWVGAGDEAGAGLPLHDFGVTSGKDESSSPSSMAFASYPKVKSRILISCEEPGNEVGKLSPITYRSVPRDFTLRAERAVKVSMPAPSARRLISNLYGVGSRQPCWRRDSPILFHPTAAGRSYRS